jgi:DNA-binding transcriptional ArsR family regulator
MIRTMPTRVESGPLASELRVVLGHLIRRLRSEHRFSLSQGSVLGRLDREGPQSTSKLAAAERVRPQSMSQTVAELEAQGLIERRPDPADGRSSLVELTAAAARAGWPGRSRAASTTRSARRSTRRCACSGGWLSSEQLRCVSG